MMNAVRWQRLPESESFVLGLTTCWVFFVFFAEEDIRRCQALIMADSSESKDDVAALPTPRKFVGRRTQSAVTCDAIMRQIVDPATFNDSVQIQRAHVRGLSAKQFRDLAQGLTVRIRFASRVASGGAMFGEDDADAPSRLPRPPASPPRQPASASGRRFQSRIGPRWAADISPSGGAASADSLNPGPGRYHPREAEWEGRGPRMHGRLTCALAEEGSARYPRPGPGDYNLPQSIDALSTKPRSPRYTIRPKTHDPAEVSAGVMLHAGAGPGSYSFPSVFDKKLVNPAESPRRPAYLNYAVSRYPGPGAYLALRHVSSATT